VISEVDFLLESVKAMGVKCLFVPIDITDAESVRTAIEKTVNEFGRLDVAFNNVSVTACQTRLHELSDGAWNRLLAINLTGQFYCLKYEIEQFLKQEGGVIVNMTSLPSRKGNKHAITESICSRNVLDITMNIAKHYADLNIRANSICPMYEEVRFDQIAPFGLKDHWEESVTANAHHLSNEVAQAFVYLASEESNYRNGSQIILEGGIMAPMH
jgi:NAD(P)-dependent dehydrogenase (short-subunit alcohol dehydrogenase family)